MTKNELPELSQRLAQLADALGGRTPSPAGLMVWGDALAESRMDDVQAALSDWPKRYSKMPVPADILKIARERVSTRVEELAAKTADGPDKALRAVFKATDSKIARRELAKIKEILSGCAGGLVAGAFRQIAGNSSLSPLDWAHVLRVRHESGEQPSLMQIANYHAALQLDPPSRRL